MFRKINIENFKSLENISLELKNLTLLTGINSSGKSSVIQVLLFVKQNFEMNENIYTTLAKTKGVSQNLIMSTVFKNLKINERYLDLGGVAKNILYDRAETDKIKISIKVSDGEVSFESDIKENKDEEAIKCNDIKYCGKLNELFSQENFCYLSADRIVPQTFYKYSKENVLKGNLGKKGEYTVHYLSENKNLNISLKELQHKDAKTEQLLENTILWLSKISKGIDIIPESNITLQYSSLKYSYGSQERLPQNIGFGVTYVLPIIVAILKAKKGDTVVIENPESHLHPSGQVEIARLCAKASEAGVQVIVETHSDHFLNGIRVAIKEKILKDDKSIVYYFSKNEKEEKTEIQKIEINQEGKIEEWPKGFFDEWDIQLEKLLW